MVKLSRRAVLLTVLGGIVLFGGTLRAGENGDEKNPDKIWAKGVVWFDKGEFSKARQEFDKLLKLVNVDIAARLVKRAGLKTMIRMMSSPDVGRSPMVIWELHSKYWRARLTDPDRIRKFVNQAIDVKTHELQRVKALHELRRIGQYAVPELAKYLSDRSDERRALVRIALSRIGTRGTLAMVQLVDTGDDLFKETLALALSDITPADNRSVPALKRLYDNSKTSEPLRGKVAYALRKITGLDTTRDMTGYADYYYLLANRYYMESTGVPEEALEYDGVIWELKKDKDGKDALTYRRVPVYSWNEELAEDLIYECLEHSPAYQRMFPLLLSVELAQREEVEAIGDAIKISGRPATMTDAGRKILDDRAKLLVDMNLLAEACGPRYLYRAVGKALRDGRHEVASAAIDLLPLLDPHGSLLPPVAPPEPLRDKRGRIIKRRVRKPVRRKVEPKKKVEAEPESGKKRWWQRKKKKTVAKKKPDAGKTTPVVAPELITSAEVKPEHEGQPLIDALDSKDDRVRVSAAIALAKMDPVVPFPGSEKVVAALSDAISKAGPLQILVVEEDDDAFKLIKPLIEEHGWGVSRATSGRDALNKAGTFPPKDLILISTKLKVDLTTKFDEEKKIDGVLERLAKGRALKLIPVALLIKKEELADEQAKFGKFPMIARTTKGVNLREDILKALGKTGPGVTKQKREEMAARAALALLEIEPRRTQLRVLDAADACQKALFNRPDKVRNPCIRALGLFKVKAAAPDLVKVFNTKTNTVLLRKNCLDALGQCDPDPNTKLFLTAQEEKEFALRNAAAIAEGKAHQTPKPEVLTKFLQARRLLRTKDGGDGRPAKHKGGAAAAPAEKKAADK